VKQVDCDVAILGAGAAGLTAKVTARQTAHFIESLAKGTPDREKIIDTILMDKVRELV
jgi:succinate dehydrogenase/fumarate reductase flavoprotein subunit